VGDINNYFVTYIFPEILCMCALITAFLIEHSAISAVIFICQYSLPPYVKEQEYEQVTVQGASLANVVRGKY